MKRLWLAITVITGTLLIATAGGMLWRHHHARQFRSYFHDGKDALNSDPRLALHLVAKIPEGAPEFVEAQNVELTALWLMVDEDEKNERMGPFSAKSREELMAFWYEKELGRPMDSELRGIVKSVAEYEDQKRASAKRRDFAASWQANEVAKGHSVTYSTQGEFDRMLIFESYELSNIGALQRVMLVFEQNNATKLFCEQGFTSVGLKIPGVSEAARQIPLDCGPHSK